VAVIWIPIAALIFVFCGSSLLAMAHIIVTLDLRSTWPSTRKSAAWGALNLTVAALSMMMIIGLLP
jgi:hypothetical protein